MQDSRYIDNPACPAPLRSAFIVQRQFGKIVHIGVYDARPDAAGTHFTFTYTQLKRTEAGGWAQVQNEDGQTVDLQTVSAAFHLAEERARAAGDEIGLADVPPRLAALAAIPHINTVLPQHGMIREGEHMLLVPFKEGRAVGDALLTEQVLVAAEQQTKIDEAKMAQLSGIVARKKLRGRRAGKIRKSGFFNLDAKEQQQVGQLPHAQQAMYYKIREYAEQIDPPAMPLAGFIPVPAAIGGHYIGMPVQIAVALAVGGLGYVSWATHRVSKSVRIVAKLKNFLSNKEAIPQRKNGPVKSHYSQRPASPGIYEI